MKVRPQDVENFAFAGWALVFILVERLWPGRLEVSRKKHFWSDLLAFVAVSAGAFGSRFALLAGGRRLGLDALLGAHALLSLPWPVKLALAVLLVDLGIYWVHRAMHASDLLWLTHRFHHSVEQLYWFSGLRTSFLHALLYALPQVGISFFVLGFGPMELAGAAVVGLFFQLYIHSSTDLGLGPLGWLFITPRAHRLHHTLGELQGKNLGNFLTLWDRLFGTWVDPDSVPAPDRLGLPERPSLARMIIGI